MAGVIVCPPSPAVQGATHQGVNTAMPGLFWGRWRKLPHPGRPSTSRGRGGEWGGRDFGEEHDRCYSVDFMICSKMSVDRCWVPNIFIPQKPCSAARRPHFTSSSWWGWPSPGFLTRLAWPHGSCGGRAEFQGIWRLHGPQGVWLVNGNPSGAGFGFWWGVLLWVLWLILRGFVTAQRRIRYGFVVDFWGFCCGFCAEF